MLIKHVREMNAFDELDSCTPKKKKQKREFNLDPFNNTEDLHIIREDVSIRREQMRSEAANEANRLRLEACRLEFEKSRRKQESEER